MSGQTAVTETMESDPSVDSETSTDPAAATSWWQRLVRPYTELRTLKELAYLLAGLPIGIASFTVAVTLIALGVSLAFTLIGLPILVLLGFLGRVFGNVERLRARELLDIDDLPAVGWAGEGERWWRRIWTNAKDPTVWKEQAYALVMLPVGIVTFVAGIVGIVLAPLGGAWIVRGTAVVNREMVRGLLGTGTGELSRQVEQLSESRARSVDAATAERQRIERALHDGAQMRLTALAMELGRAKERIHTDPAGAADLVDEAHAEAKRALVELRDLARGIHPAVLTDRGLDAALRALAARASIPIEVHVDLPQRPPSAIEATAYYVVAEALNNVTRHSGASHAAVRIDQRAGWLVVEVEDDGCGGAAIGEASAIVPTGLRGLADRVAGVDGTIDLASPLGGPTVLRAELPCAS